MELIPGFKLSEAGPIPDDWEAVRLGDSRPFVTSGSRGWSRYYAETGNLFVRITNMFRDDVRLNLYDVRFVQPPPQDAEVERTALQLNDLLISITADIGIVSLVTADVPLPAFVNQHIAAVRLAPDTIDALYAAYALKSGHSSAWFRAITDAGAKAGINLTTVRETPIIAPPLPEQRAIAEVLGEIDAWIVTAEAEAAKLASVKAAAMYALLTPTTRLPGFEGEWQQKQLGEVAPLQRGFDLPYSSVVNGDVPVIASNGVIAWHNDGPIKGPGLVTGRSGTIGKVQYVAAERYWPHNTALWVTNCYDNCLRFLAYKFDTIGLAELATGSGVPTLDRKDVHAVVIGVPHPEEQRAIAAVLTDIDTALAAARAVVAKAKSLKAAAMDALLSGRIRLPLP